MKTKNKLIILILLVVLAGCNITNKTPQTTKPINNKDYLVIYINDNKVYLKNIKTNESWIVFEPKEVIDFIIPNPTMKVIAYTTKENQNKEKQLKIYDWGKDQHFEVSSVQSEMPVITWSGDGCYLMKYESQIGNWGNALIYNFVTQRVSCELTSIAEPTWNVDSNRILAHIPQHLQNKIPFDNGNSSTLIVYDVADKEFKTILEGNEEVIYRSLKWLAENEIAYRRFNVKSAEEQIHRLNLISGKDDNITDKVNELIFVNPPVPKEFYEYQYYQLTADQNFAILCTMSEKLNSIELYNKETGKIKNLASGYCASWVNWKMK